MNKRFNKTLISVAVAGLVSSPAAFATNGYFAHGFGTKAKGMGGAGVAYAQDAMAAATNPAGMVHVGNRFDVGLEFFKPNREVETAWSNVAPGVVHKAKGNEDELFFIPEFGYNKMLDDNSSFGLTVFGNGGMNTSYDESIFGGAAASKNTRSNLEQLFISPSYAKKIDDKQSFGIAVNFVLQRF